MSHFCSADSFRFLSIDWPRDLDRLRKVLVTTGSGTVGCVTPKNTIKRYQNEFFKRISKTTTIVLSKFGHKKKTSHQYEF